MKKVRFFSKIALAASVSLALAFTISCSSDNDDGGSNNGISGEPITIDGQTYRTVVIGDQTWMATNLNSNLEGSKCYGDNSSNCAKYGRLYDWETARNACPGGWYLPSQEVWGELLSFVDGRTGSRSESETAGAYLKATSGWDNSGNGEDTHGFAALPGGKFLSEDYNNFIEVGISGYWWSAEENNSSEAFSIVMYDDDEYVDYGSNYKSDLLSVRCYTVGKGTKR